MWKHALYGSVAFWFIQLSLLACLGGASQATAAFVEFGEQLVVVKSSTADSIAVSDADSAYSIPATLLNLPVMPGNELVLDVAFHCAGCSTPKGTVVRAWKLSEPSWDPDTAIRGVVISVDHGTSDSDTINVAVESLDWGSIQRFRLQDVGQEVADHDTITVVSYKVRVERKTDNGTLVTRACLWSPGYAIMDHRSSWR